MFDVWYVHFECVHVCIYFCRHIGVKECVSLCLFVYMVGEVLKPGNVILFRNQVMEVEKYHSGLCLHVVMLCLVVCRSLLMMYQAPWSRRQWWWLESLSLMRSLIVIQINCSTQRSATSSLWPFSSSCPSCWWTCWSVIIVLMMQNFGCFFFFFLMMTIYDDDFFFFFFLCWLWWWWWRQLWMCSWWWQSHDDDDGNCCNIYDCPKLIVQQVHVTKLPIFKSLVWLHLQRSPRWKRESNQGLALCRQMPWPLSQWGSYPGLPLYRQMPWPLSQWGS